MLIDQDLDPASCVKVMVRATTKAGAIGTAVGDLVDCAALETEVVLDAPEGCKYYLIVFFCVDLYYANTLRSFVCPCSLTSNRL